MKRKPSVPHKFPLVTEEMKAWSTALATETSEWPTVTAKSFFGFTALYRGKVMFAALPRTRSFSTANAVLIRFDQCGPKLQVRLENDRRIAAFHDRSKMNKSRNQSRWFSFELSRDADLHDALEWLAQSHQAAGKAKRLK